MGGLYSGKSLISYSRKDNNKSIINHKNGSELKLWKGNILEYKHLPEQKNNVFYLINTPLEECLDMDTYDSHDMINGDVYNFIDDVLGSFTPDLEFRITVSKANESGVFSYEPLHFISYEELYEKYISGKKINGVGSVKYEYY